LTAARLEAEAPPPLQAVDVAALLRDLVEEFRVTGHALDLHMPPTAVVVQGRPDSLRRVFTNLVDNAFKHGVGPVQISIAQHTGDSGDAVDVSVRDAGPGVPVEDRERIFERFWRIDKNRQTPGIGLGLSIVQGLVVACGGKVWTEAPDHGDGAVFRVRLRATTPSLPADELAPSSS
ncbi:MAG: sensor histidine kinase, partial [Actinomycetota bacterium]|nr:sensor histidine kinase [Actinomycetota bacterium]